VTQSRLTLILAGGGLVILAPLVSIRLHGAENSIFSVMQTLTEVKESLDEKRTVLEEIGAATRHRRERPEDIALARSQYRAAHDIFQLTSNFIAVADRKFPRYHAFLANVNERVTRTFEDIQRLSREITGEPRAVVARGAPAQVPGGAPSSGAPAPAASGALADPDLDRMAVESSHGAIALGRPAPDGSEDGDPRGPALPVRAISPELKDRYRQGYQLYVRGTRSDHDEARRIFEEIVAQEPAFYLAQYWLTKIQIAQGDIAAAQASVKRLIERQPHLITARLLAREVGDLASGAPAGAGTAEPDLSGAGPGAAPAGGPATRPRPGTGLKKPIAFVVDWKPGAGEPSGVSGAYLLHEVPEGPDGCRILALYKGLPEKPVRVGPIAAADADLVAHARTYGAWAVHLAGRTGTGERPAAARTAPIVDDRSYPDVFERDAVRPAPHDRFAHPVRVAAALASGVGSAVPIAAGIPGFPRLDAPPPASETARVLQVRRTAGRDVTFRFDAPSGLFVRQTPDGRDARDSGDGQPLAAANVLVQKGRPGPDGTRFTIHRAGDVIEARLARDPESPLVGVNGRSVLLAPGPVWILGERSPAAAAAAAAAATATVPRGGDPTRPAGAPAARAGASGAVRAGAEPEGEDEDDEDPGAGETGGHAAVRPGIAPITPLVRARSDAEEDEDEAPARPAARARRPAGAVRPRRTIADEIY
jgi:hypothetical protein